jgi:2-polyprenyl-6-methoxyphenol hydroxylase-like FAD-dependent oxidoreductase
VNASRPEAEETTCCIVGCGPAGAMLGLLLARAGVHVLVLEKHDDFFRDFRGDTVHPSTIEVIEELGLLDRFSRVPQEHASTLRAWTDAGVVEVADFRSVRLRHPYIAFVPQWDLLDFLTEAAAEYEGFDLRMGAEVVELARAGDRVTGVRYRAGGALREVRADLTVAADGRDSTVRQRAGLEPVRYGAPMDVLWFRVTRSPSDPAESLGRVSSGRFVALIARGSYWQLGYVIPKGSDARLRQESIAAFRASLRELVPFLADRLDHEPASWGDVKTLSVQVDRLRRWHGPGLLCIGDAAHAMSPVGGVGINLAVQDAVAAGNLLARPLRDRSLATRHLARVQLRRWLPTAVTQTLQRVVQRRLLVPVLERRAGAPAGLLRRLAQVRALRRVPARMIGVGVLPEHVRAPAGAGRRAATSRGGPDGEAPVCAVGDRRRAGESGRSG